MRFITLSLLLLAGCSPSSDGLTPRQKDHQLLAKLISQQNGRYRYVEPTGEYPALIVDTATGCVEVLTMQQIDNVDGKVLQKYTVGYGMQGADRSCNLLGKATVSSESEK